jgi:hypothetical protein
LDIFRIVTSHSDLTGVHTRAQHFLSSRFLLFVSKKACPYVIIFCFIPSNIWTQYAFHFT